MGYYKESKSHWLFDPIKRKIIIRQRVQFDEKSSGINLLNASSGLLQDDPLDVASNIGSPVPYSIPSTISITSLFWLDHQPPSRLVHLPFFQLVRWLKTLLFVINLLKWTEVHLFIFYPDGMSRQLNFLELMLEMPPTYDILEVKINMPMFPWWLV